MHGLQFAKVFLPNLLRSLFAEVFYRQCFLLYGKLDIDISNVHVSKLITGRGIINWMPMIAQVFLICNVY